MIGYNNFRRPTRIDIMQTLNKSPFSLNVQFANTLY